MANILIIDDSQSVRIQLRQCLEAAGHTVAEGTDGIHGLEQLTTVRPDLAIVDYNMPGSDGITMLKKAREQLGELKFPVFMLTTETSSQFKEAGKAVGIRAWIVKPFNPEKLLAAIAKVLGL